MGVSLTGLSGPELSAFARTGDGLGGVRKKITDLEKQKDSYEKELGKISDPKLSEELQNKINGLDGRIENLRSRLEKKAEEMDGECQTCKNRKYQDGSDDPGVSFKSATKVRPEAAAAAVRGHEMEHVYRNQAKASREGREVVSQSVVIKTAICPECGKPYVAGGETKTVTRAKPETRFNVGLEDNSKGAGFDAVA